MSVKNISLYIIRAEIYQSKEYIMNALHTQGYGKPKSVEFYPKENERGQKYNGAVVYFEKWYMNKHTEQLLTKIVDSEETAVIYHSKPKYWNVKEHRQPVAHSATTVIEKQEETESQLAQMVESMSIGEKNTYYEDVINSLKMQLLLEQKKSEKQEQLIMEYEEKHDKDWYQNMKLHSKIDDLELELSIQSEENYSLREINEELEHEVKHLENELYEYENMVEYYKSQRVCPY
jgi:hypothetical protein